jgi:hypothetical protein
MAWSWKMTVARTGWLRLGLDPGAFWAPAAAVPRGRMGRAWDQRSPLSAAGSGGLTAAVALARQGLAAEVYEQAPALEEVGSGVGLWLNAMAALEPIGLSGKVAQLAVTVGGQGVRRPDGRWLMYIPEGVMAKRWGSGS